ncbi:MAG: sensor histidine kinase [Hominilimicola sp.]
MKKAQWQAVGQGCLVILAAIVLLAACIRSNQSINPIPLRASFRGEYKIADGEWKPIVKGEKISSMDGDVTLKGYFRTEGPDGEVIGRVTQGSPISLYFNHIGAEIFINGESAHVFDAENPQIGESACGKQRVTYTYTGTDTDTVEIVLKNPHRFGNYSAVNDFLDSMYMYSGPTLDKLMLKQGVPDRIIGIFVMIAALMVLGVAVCSFLLRMPQGKTILLIGLMMLFAGGYYVLDSPNVGIWNESVVFNTCVLQLCMMLYVFFMMCFTVKCLPEKMKKAGEITVTAVGALSGVSLIISLAGGIGLYDLNIYWAAVQILAGLVLLGGCIYALKNADKKQRLMLIVCILPLGAMLADILGTAAGWWQGGMVSKIVFILIFVIALIIVLKIIPSNFRAAVEAEKMAAELKNSRISIMLSQIQPHFLYNSINAIRELCRINPEQAREALGDFASYLRGNMDCLASHTPIHFSKELSHVETYLKLEKMRFGDNLNVVYDIREKDFFLPSLTVQPLVENAVKHGICENENGGTLTLRTRKEAGNIIIEVIDDGVGFDMENPALWEDGHSHIGIDNIRMRLQQMCGGSLTVKSSAGKGTVAVIELKIKEESSKKSVDGNVYVSGLL